MATGWIWPVVFVIGAYLVITKTTILQNLAQKVQAQTQGGMMMMDASGQMMVMPSANTVVPDATAVVPADMGKMAAPRKANNMKAMGKMAAPRAANNKGMMMAAAGGKKASGQTLFSLAECVAAGASMACCQTAMASGGTIKGYEVGNCKKCGKREC
jgi:hypothetical protein